MLRRFELEAKQLTACAGTWQQFWRGRQQTATRRQLDLYYLRCTYINDLPNPPMVTFCCLLMVSATRSMAMTKSRSSVVPKKASHHLNRNTVDCIKDSHLSVLQSSKTARLYNQNTVIRDMFFSRSILAVFKGWWHTIWNFRMGFWNSLEAVRLEGNSFKNFKQTLTLPTLLILESAAVVRRKLDCFISNNKVHFYYNKIWASLSRDVLVPTSF